MNDEQPMIAQPLTEAECFVFEQLTGRFGSAIDAINRYHTDGWTTTFAHATDLLDAAILHRERIIRGIQVGVIPVSVVPTLFDLIRELFDIADIESPPIFQCADGLTMSINVGADFLATADPRDWWTHAEVGHLNRPAPELDPYATASPGRFGSVPCAVIETLIENHGGFIAFLERD